MPLIINQQQLTYILFFQRFNRHFLTHAWINSITVIQWKISLVHEMLVDIKDRDEHKKQYLENLKEWKLYYLRMLYCGLKSFKCLMICQMRPSSI